MLPDASEKTGNRSADEFTTGTAAGEVFRRMVWLNPRDNQGARFMLGDVEAGRSWEEAQADEVDA